MDILNNIKPDKKESVLVRDKTKKFLSRLNKNLKYAKAIVGGSFEKNTWLSGNYDVDIFVKFNYKKYKNENISKKLEMALKNFRKTKIHGSRDYFQIKQGKFNFEIVPVLDIKNYRQALNVTDVSPLHSKFVKKHSNRKLQDQIRLSKQFFRANDLYGAESYIGGFSGYAIELLLVHYKSFNDFIKHAAKWQDSLVIDVKRLYKNEKDAERSINWAKKGPLILIDPVQKNRNVAAALSKQKYNKFRSIAKEYLRNPNDDYFIRKEFDLKKLKNYSILEITPKSGKIDIIGAKLLKLHEKIKNEISEEGYTIIEHGWNFDKKTHFWFKVEKERIDLTKKHYGPFIDDKLNLKKFKKKWKGYKIYKENDKVYIILERKFNNINDFLRSLIKDRSITDQVKDIIVL